VEGYNRLGSVVRILDRACKDRTVNWKFRHLILFMLFDRTFHYGVHLVICSNRQDRISGAARVERAVGHVHSKAHKVIAGYFLSPDPEVT
jgi:hypothetical protein